PEPVFFCGPARLCSFSLLVRVRLMAFQYRIEEMNENCNKVVQRISQLVAAWQRWCTNISLGRRAVTGPYDHVKLSDCEIVELSPRLEYATFPGGHSQPSVAFVDKTSCVLDEISGHRK